MAHWEQMLFKGEIIMSGTNRNKTSKRKADAERIAAVKSARNAGSGYSSGRSSSGRSSSGSARRTTSSNRRRRRRQKPDIAKMLLIGIGIVIAILCVAVGLKGCAKDGDEQKKDPTTSAAVPETEIHAEITVNGISVNGLTKSEAMEKILADLGWDMKVSYNGETKEVENLISYNVDHVLEEALGTGEAGAYEVSASGLEDQVKAAVDTLASGWDVQAKNGSISSYDKASGEFQFSGAKVGTVINRDALVSDILLSMESGDYTRTIEASAKEVQPEITEAQAKASFKRLGTYTTTTTSNKARNENIRIAAEALNGIIVQPGEEFSFNLTTGNRTKEKGYQAAGAYVNGVLVEEPGGGVCQVSSTLYNAVVFSGLKTTERHAHSYEPSYVTPGEDAMVSYDGHSGPDMKFVNNSKTAVGIKTSFSNQKLTVSVYGNPILEDGVTLSMVSTKVKELDPPAPVYEEDQTLEPGVEVEVKAATMGSRWVTNLVTKKNGEVIEEILLHNSTYNGKSATIKRNTSGVVVPAEGESTSAASTASSENTGSAAGEPTNASGQNSSTETTASSPASGNTPGGNLSGNGAQNVGPGDVIAPSSGSGNTSDGPGAGGSTNIPQSPADVTSPAGGNSPASGNSGVSAETSSGPGSVGLIAPNE